MDIFSLREQLIEDYRLFTGSFVTPRNPKIQALLERRQADNAQRPDPWLSLNPAFATGGSVDDLVGEGRLHPECARIFRRKESPTDAGRDPIVFHRHQRDAIGAAASGRSYVLTTGTGSGKSLAYIVPIVDRVLRERASGRPGVKAFIVYPMNALANSQVEELRKFVQFGYSEGEEPVSFARYTGQENPDERRRILGHPPDILLTNYVMPRYWVAEAEVSERLSGRWEHDWLLGFRDICRSTDERTMICAPFPLAAVGNKLPILLPRAGSAPCLAAVLSSFVVDFVARQKLGGTTMNFFYLKQLTILDAVELAEYCRWAPAQILQDWVEGRLDELIYTVWDMAPAALALGDDGPPFVWDPERRAVIRAELDAAMFHLYGVGRDDVDYILGTFPIVNRNDVKAYGEERTRRLVLEAYDAMAKALDSGVAFESSLIPPPGDGPRHPVR